MKKNNKQKKSSVPKKKIIKTKKPSVSNEDLLLAISNISKKLAYKFKFGYHDIEDMKQQISIFAIEGLKRYDHKRPLENFLWTHVRNRLFNYKRDNYQRPDKPCLTCPLYDKVSTNCKKYGNKLDCSLYDAWYNRNDNKKKLMHLTSIDELKDYGNIFLANENNIGNKEIFKILDESLTGEHRITYLKILGGDKVNKIDNDKLVVKIKEILKIK
jgi:hypothetical protein